MALDGQKVIVIGGSSGIGRGAAADLLGREAHVVLFGRSLDRSRRPAPSRESRERLGRRVRDHAHLDCGRAAADRVKANASARVRLEESSTERAHSRSESVRLTHLSS
jgi:NAD(P)-dependent dehydrogenase (short-subunit alcohol dehydrogenase family)